MSERCAAILRALQLIAPPTGIIEVRALTPWTASGYYSVDRLEDAAKAVEALDAAGTHAGIYTVLNAIDPALLSRRANRIETRLPRGAAATSDGDIIRRRWLPIDIDPVRPSGISSTDEEHNAALEAAGRIAGYLQEVCGFPAGILADSGNGAHLLYRIDLPNDEQSTDLIERCLQALGALFDKSATEEQPGYVIDRTMFNASRICKLYATVSRKGDHTPDRPHRRSRILEVPDEIEVVRPGALATLAAQAPDDEVPKQQAPRPPGIGPGIDLDDWLREHGASLPEYRAKAKPDYRVFYEFPTCPWNSAHTDSAAWVGQRTNGPIQAGCHHTSCSGRTWHDLKALVEPKRSKKSTPAKTPAPGATSAGDEAATPFNLTDAGNSERLVRLFGGDIRHCATLKSWYVWDGRRWEIDEVHRMLDLATQTARSIFTEAAGAGTIEEREAIARWAMRSESLTARRAAIDGSVFMVPVRPDELDDRPELFNCLNGTLNLDTGEFRDHRREDLLTMIAGVEYTPGATCPLWLDHLKIVFRDDSDLIAGFQAFCGYALLQFNPEQIMAILWGGGKNGKSETLKTIALILRDYAVNIESATLMQSRYTDAGRARPDILTLKGARFSTVTEPEQNSELSESLVKSITGDHKLTARPLYGNPIEFVPGAKICLATNHLPGIQGTDDGIWRRIWLFEFLATIPADKRQPEYGQILYEQEGAGIFLWMLEGLKRYQEHGKLIQPEAVQKATRQYRISKNPVGLFLDEECITTSQHERVGKSDFYETYKVWCENKGWEAWSMRRIGTLMKSLFADYSDGTRRYWIGIRLKTEVERANEDHLDESLPSSHPAADTSLTQPYTTSQTFPSTPTRTKVCEEVSGSVRNDNGTLATWFEQVRLPRNFTLGEHTHHPEKSRVCSISLCNRPATWQGKGGSWPICEHHYEIIAQKIKEAQK